MTPPRLVIDVPDWLAALQGPAQGLPTLEQRMRFVVDIARRNVETGTGGPFGAAVFAEDGALVGVGANLVVAGRCSLLHAEIVAIARAQQAVGNHDLAQGGAVRTQLVTSTEPCAMCLGAVAWSGVSSLACGARDEDARRIGFDEGPKPADWRSALEGRGIAVSIDVLRADSVAVLELYASSGGAIYNPARR